MKERIEIGNKLYQHYFVNLPWWFPKQWDADEITQIDFGNYNYESITTLNVRRGRKRDMIAYWAKSDFRKMLFEKIRTHLDEIDSNIPVVNLNAE